VNRIAYERGGDFPEVDTSGALQFTLCGHGPNCSIDTGKASVERYELVQRQALELALYTFKYVDGVEKVTVLLPPSFDTQSVDASGSPEEHRTAVFLQRQDVTQELSRPLYATLDQATARIAKVDDRDLGSIRRLTVPHTYSYALTQAQDGAVVLVLKSAVSG
jgi:hypothetical protein